MLNDQSATSHDEDGTHDPDIRDIHAVTPPRPINRGRRREAWETGSHRSSNLSVGSEGLSENFTTMSREFNALVLAGSAAAENTAGEDAGGGPNLSRIGEELEETNPLAIVPDNGGPMDPVPSPMRAAGGGGSSMSSSSTNNMEEVSLHRVKKEETETKISAWQTAEIAKINNRFKREDAIINGWESEAAQKATMWMKKIERKLEEKRAKALEKMQNDIAKAHRKAEEKRASAEAKRGTKVARVLEVSNLMRAVGRAPSKRSFF